MVQGPYLMESVFIENGGGEGDSFQGLLVTQVLLLFSFRHMQKTYKAVLVDWFLWVTEQSDNLTGMWIVAFEENCQGQHIHTVVSLDTILHPAHLISIYEDAMVPIDFHFMHCLDTFCTYYVNKYIDHHSHTIAFWLYSGSFHCILLWQLKPTLTSSCTLEKTEKT